MNKQGDNPNGDTQQEKELVRQLGLINKKLPIEIYRHLAGHIRSLAKLAQAK